MIRALWLFYFLIACQHICLGVEQLKDLRKYLTFTSCLLLQKLNIVLIKSIFLWTATKSVWCFSHPPVSLSSPFILFCQIFLLGEQLHWKHLCEHFVHAYFYSQLPIWRFKRRINIYFLNVIYEFSSFLTPKEYIKILYNQLFIKLSYNYCIYVALIFTVYIQC